MRLRAFLPFLSALVTGCSCQPPPQGADDEVYIPAGSFTMGHDKLPEKDICTQLSPTHNPCNGFAPRHTVTLDPFFIDKREASIREYRQCVSEGICKVPRWDTSSMGFELGKRYEDAAYLDFPMVGGGYDNALRFCNWRGRRLPTEAEWERAARGTSERDYPWGNEKPTCERVPECQPTAIGWTTEYMRAVGTTPGDATPEGVLDMYGDARELVSDCYEDDYYQHSPEKNPLGLPPNTLPDGSQRCFHVVRGGYFNWEPRGWTGWAVSWARSDEAGIEGFR
ncbi:MAG: formylglycine-generating enzyme family protein, partial [Myxococcaceae bacterium]